MKLIPATVDLARAEIRDRREFERLLGATVPDDWPPESLADALAPFLAALEASPDYVGWFSRYGLATDTAAAVPVLVASGGFQGPPGNGTVEIGYSVLPQFEGQGYATEMVRALARWALEQPGVARVVAETEWANPASARVLIKAGFSSVGSAANAGGTRYELLGRTYP